MQGLHLEYRDYIWSKGSTSGVKGVQGLHWSKGSTSGVKGVQGLQLEYRDYREYSWRTGRPRKHGSK